ncbi:uncharacterized protein BKCO1_10000015 [Diplodia corticola]|uniref:Uncharacterized protein n=1 Tax=Diplodia corticola TaxID=236234 RepID=A0A1J9QLN0_9PEZI|nr:uncharacterized protein BKCO1_10000015 [Diplodia corticola]OJD28970.1 hypothetical protein BKCO1_10000015 [Diplodia corticola]
MSRKLLWPFPISLQFRPRRTKGPHSTTHPPPLPAKQQRTDGGGEDEQTADADADADPGFGAEEEVVDDDDAGEGDADADAEAEAEPEAAVVEVSIGQAGSVDARRTMGPKAKASPPGAIWIVVVPVTMVGEVMA